MSARRRRWIAALTIAVVAVGASAAFVLANGETEEPEAVAAPTTEQVTVQDLVETMTATGTLGFADQRTIGVSKNGVVTWLPEEKSVLKRGDVAVRVNDIPIVVLYGDLPSYRKLEYGVDDGPDVEQLKQNLDKLGLLPAGVTVDEEFTWGTRQAVKNLQEELGVEETGGIEPSDVIVVPGAVQVGAPAEQSASVGDPAGPLYEASGTDREVVVELSPTDARLVSVDDEATVTLPDGGTTAATVTGIGATTTDQQGTAVVPVTLALDDPESAGDSSGVPVSVELVSEVTDDVLTVPVVALIALAEGGYAVEVVSDNGTTRLVPVDPGKYAGGVVAVEGAVAEGDEVVVPS